MTGYSITIPNTLSWAYKDVENVIELIITNLDNSPLIYDLQRVDFLNPYGVLLLLLTTRYVTQETGYKVCFTNIQENTHAYLERIDFFSENDSWLYTDIDLLVSKRYSRADASENLLEITRLTSIKAQLKFQSRTRDILTTWLDNTQHEIDRVVTVLSELCNNAREHSEDEGHVLIQKYRRSDHTEVHIAVADLGIGISESLSRKHNQIADDSIGYIFRALEGFSARGKHHGGAGLKIVQERISKQGGQLAIRSHQGLVTISGEGEPVASETTYFPGTQVSVKLRSYWA